MYAYGDLRSFNRLSLSSREERLFFLSAYLFVLNSIVNQLAIFGPQMVESVKVYCE